MIVKRIPNVTLTSFEHIKSSVVRQWAATVSAELDTLITRLNERFGTVAAALYSVTDIAFPISTARIPAANAPTWATFTTNTGKYTFATNDYVDLESNELVHGYDEGQDVDWHLHIFTNGLDGTDRTVKYEISYCVTNPDGAASEVTVSLQYTIAASTADKTHLIIAIADVTGTSFEYGADITARLKRVATDSGTDPTSDPFVSMVGLHVPQDKIGSART